MKTREDKKAPELHYGWIIMITGSFCIFACLGLGRFSLGMLLPSMGEALQLSYTEMGLISTSNFIGYLLAVLLSSRLMRIVGARRLIGSALLLVALSMVSIGFAQDLPFVIVLYVLTGMGSAFANVPTMALIAIWFSSSLRGKAAGYVVIGSGFAIILSGQLIPFINSTGPEGWRTSWYVLGAIVAMVSLVCTLLFRNNPTELGLHPVGYSPPPAGKDTLQTGSTASKAPSSQLVWHCGIIYFLFGFTYVAYATFIVTFMVQECGFPESTAGIFWSCVGLLSLISGPALGTFSDVHGRRAGLLVVFSVQSFAYLLAALNISNAFLFVSIACFGVVAWSIPTIITALVGDIAGPERVAAVFGFVTFIFGIGQISGPFLTGLIAEKSGSFTGSFTMICLLASLAVVLSALLPKERNRIKQE